MIIRRHSKTYNFYGDSNTGVCVRWAEKFSDDPVCAPWPELADISISNHCSNNCSFCYRDSQQNCSFIRLNDFKYILDSLQHPTWGNVFQIALGGGEPLEHPNFLDIIDLSNLHGITTNFTTNGSLLNNSVIDSIKDKVGAIAISTCDLRVLDFSIIRNVINAGIKTNIHYLLTNKTIIQAISILKGEFDSMLDGVNAIIFLTFKPSGRGKKSNCLHWNDSLSVFLNLIENKSSKIRTGFDSCFVPTLLHKTKLPVNLLDPCECAFFSIFIDENLNVKPCSFSSDNLHSFNMMNFSLIDIWENKLKDYRNSIYNKCNRECDNKEYCKGPCIYYDDLNICYTNHKDKKLS